MADTHPAEEALPATSTIPTAATADGSPGAAVCAADASAAQQNNLHTLINLNVDKHRIRSPACTAPQPPGRKYLAYFLHRHLAFRMPEVEALAAMHGVEDLQWQLPHSGNPMTPFWHVWLADDGVARHIASRTVLLKGFLEVWGEGATLDELVADVKAHMPSPDSDCFSADRSWKILLDAWGCALPEDDDMLFRRMGFLPFQGRVSLSAPDHQFRLMRASTETNRGMPHMPLRWYFCRQVAMSDRKSRAKYKLAARRYLGPTSMDDEMAAIMVNQAQVQRGSLVLDPFVGTGSMLVAAAAVGAVTLGTDIDMRVIRLGKVDSQGRTVDLWTNFADYGLPAPVGLLRADAHLPPWRAGLECVIDAVVADPPYGVRAGARKSEWKEYVMRPQGAVHFPATAPYSLAECLADLLDSSARLLIQGGRLAYFLPVAPDLYTEADVPTHPALRVLANSEQLLSGPYSRRLITMEKHVPYCGKAAAAHRAAGIRPSHVDRVAEIVYEPRHPGGKPVDEAQRHRNRYRSKKI